ncbi:type VI secretion protein Vgr [Snodgrassella alvi]|uniref:type VI secretion system Vgr family protein n=1 Tax=Snodgrassella alvi TaxID=1196083 RepID=UPI000C1E4A1D|nr:type VI secretion system tip protein TssI/VgrG [Snodgrassella alvi]PIT11060.1 type VI secretion protein Vgr [Snodgrassella alvi]PIT55239.1 type VI secretion protein Vgr [Snodgrassella alvi]
MSFKSESDKLTLPGNSPSHTPTFVGNQTATPDVEALVQAGVEQVAGQLADKASAAIQQVKNVANTATQTIDALGNMGAPSPLMKAAQAAVDGAAAPMMNILNDMPADAQDIIDAISGTSSGGTRTVNVSGSAVPAGMLTFASMSGQEALSELFNYTIRLKTPDKLNIGYYAPSSNFPLKSMVGKDLSIDIGLENGGNRYISGLVTAARVVGHQGRGVVYELRLEPWLELATRTSDYKIFQNKSVVDIIDEVLGDYPFEMEKRLTETYPKRNFQVQYGETDYDFLQRLMQEFGIYYFFEHSADNHKLILVDAIGSHKPCPDAPSVSFHQQGLKLDKEFIHTITAQESLRTGKWVLDDFDFQKPKAKLTSTVAKPRETGHPDYEHYEWPGDYFDKSEGEFLTKVRMEAQKSLGSRVYGSGNIRTMVTGCTFNLDNCPTVEANREYLIVETSFMIQDMGEHSSQGQHFEYNVNFELLPTSEVYRPQRTINKPHTHGPQSAIVTGPSGEEIWTDKYGRVKVQFLWDRYGQWDENSSCWIRVTQPWAGKGFGGMQIPRVGQEVIVDFKNGDPDLPIITGRVYNADTMPAWGLPANKTQSGMFSHSIGGGPNNANALRFEDKPGQEELWLHAEKDQRIEVNNDESHWVGNDRTKTIDHDEKINVGHDRTTLISNDCTRAVKVNDKVLIGGMKSTSVSTEYVIAAGEKIRLSCGQTVLELHADGQFNITCAKFNITASQSGQINTLAGLLDLNIEGGKAEAAAGADGDQDAINASVAGKF